MVVIDDRSFILPATELAEALSSFDERGGNPTELIAALGVEGMFTPEGEQQVVNHVRRALELIGRLVVVPAWN